MHLSDLMHSLCKRSAFIALCAAVPVLPATAQQPVPIGSGTIASAPPTYKAKTSPDGPGFNATAMLSRKIYADELPGHSENALDIPGRPIPTNDWWTDIINSRFSGSLWSYPAMLRTFDDGIQVNYPSYWADMGKEIKSRSSVTVGAHRFRASAAIAKDWHDWDVVFRMPSATGDGEISVTSVHGSPFTWFEFAGIESPEIRFSDTPTFFGSATGMTGVKIGNDLYGIYYPETSAYSVNSDGVMTFDNAPQWIAVGLLRSETELAAFARYATSIPRDTKVSWAYDENSARISSYWQVTAENLRNPAESAPVLQGFLPHAYKYALPGASLNFIDDSGFMTPRGTMKLAVSESGSFGYAFQFSGMLPAYAAPAEGEGFRREVLDRLMEDYASRGSFGADTYWGGKGLVQMALNMSFAKESGNTEVYTKSRDRLRQAFTDWLTYTPGEDNFFFSYYPRWGAMLGFDVSYDSDAFNDHHFHYGYFTYAAALLCMEDRAFAEEYGELLTMIAKDYANWDRTDTRFPFMRTLDPWCGHSWAGGLGDHGNDNGNGQESTSEAMQGWGGIYLLGVALDNKEMRDAGIWGWNTEARATREYWYDVDAPRPANPGGRKPWPGKGERRGNYDYNEYPYAYNSNITGKGIGWWTWFGGDPLFMHGIQWMPVSPALDYLSWDPDFVGWAFDDMMSGANSTFSHEWFEPTANSDNGEPIEPLAANDWGNVALAYMQRHDPAEAARIFDEALDRGMHIATSTSTSHISYFVIHSHLTYGDPDFSIHADIPTAQVCVRADGTTTYLVYNPGTEDRKVNFSDASGRIVKSVTAPARRLAAISADPVPADIEYTLGGGNIVPPGTEAPFSTRVVDQYGAGMTGTDVSVALSPGAPASIAGGKLKINNNASRGASFDITISCGTLTRKLTVTVNDRPVAASAAITGIPAICERGMIFTPRFYVTDQYGTTSEPDDVIWSLSDENGPEKNVSSPLSITRAGNYTLKAFSGSAAGSASIPLFVSPALPLVSRGAKVAASSAENAGSMPEGAVDGDNSVRWGSAHTDSEWLVVDLGEECYLSHVDILWEAAYAARYAIQLAPADAELTETEVVYAGAPRTVTVPVESAWTTVTEESASAPGAKDSPLNASGRYLRLLGLERGSAYGYSLYEISAYGVPASMPANAVIGVDFGLPEAMDRDATIELMPKAYTRGGDVAVPESVEWSADKDADFTHNRFTPRSHGLYRITATLPGGASSDATVFVNDVERPASIALEKHAYTVIEGDDVRIPFTVMNQFLAPYTGNAADIRVRITDEGGAETSAVSYDVSEMIFRSLESPHSKKYVLDFGGLASCTVDVKALSEVNLALGKEATASGTNGDNKAALAVDGNTDTRWESTWEDSQSISVDLDGIYILDRVNIVWEGAFAREYRLQTSVDGEVWFDFYSESASAGGSENIAFSPVASRYLRLACDVRALPAYGFSVKELEVYGISRLSESSATPGIRTFDISTDNGEINATVAATHSSGAVFLTLELLDASGNMIEAVRRALPSDDEWTAGFSELPSGTYSLMLTAADAFGNATSERIDDIKVTYSIVGFNLALNKKAWASSSENGGLAASYAVDGDLTTRWGSLFNDEEWIIVDLGAPYPLTNVKIHWNEPAYATHYSVLLSLTDDDSDFRLAAERRNWTHRGEAEDIAVDREEPARYVKVVGHRRATGYGTSINELEVYGRDLSLGVDSPAIDAADSREAWYGIDGRTVDGRPSAPGIYIRVKGTRAQKIIIR